MIRYSLVLCLVFLFAGCTDSSKKVPVELTWKMGRNGAEPRSYDNSFIIKNISDKPLDKNWVIYFSQLPMHIRQAADAPVKVEPVNANFFKMSPTSYYHPLGIGDSLKITFIASTSILKISQAPEGTYFQSLAEGDQKPLALPLKVVPFTNDSQWSRPGVAELPYPDGEYVYKENLRFSEPVKLMASDIFPSVKDCEYKEGNIIITPVVRVDFESAFANEAKVLIEKLKQAHHVTVSGDGKTVISLKYLPKDTETVNNEHYFLNIDKEQITIQGHTPHAVFNGVQTLLGMLKNKTFPCEINQMRISDYPDLPYRGMMLDIARNFTVKDNLTGLIDRISSYKLNVLHFHFSDDEGWRVEIPGLEELTEIGSRRGFTTDEQQCLYPAYDGNFDPESTVSSGNGYYSRADFISLLKYAQCRHVQVIPEIELPGHARAAIVAMKARYNKYIATDKAKATEYLLSETEDTSRYSSAQYYNDNIINVALPSTYRFIEKVTDELIAMYKEAGVPLSTIHVGGDEVPEGVWTGSPLCRELMEQHQMTDVRQLSSYFLLKVNDMLKQRGLELSGWQEVALNHDPSVDKILTANVAGVYCWNTVPGWGGEEVPYQSANKGYNVILCNVNNFYMDMAYNKHPEEPGLYWGGFTNEHTTFNMLPFDIYKSARVNMKGEPVDLQRVAEGKAQLAKSALSRIKGVQAQVFSETIRKFSSVEYFLFPKIFGLVERGWNAVPEWSEIDNQQEQETAYLLALAHYNAKITQIELPYLNREGVNFRVSQPGLIVVDGKLHANSSIPTAEIRYTTDGSEPTTASTLWTEPVICDVPVVKAKLFYQGKGSVTTLLRR